MSRRDRTWAEWTAELWADPFDEPPFPPAALPELDAARGGALLDTANALAYYTPRVALAFLRAAPPVAAHLGPDRFQAWANAGQALAPAHWELACEYFRVAPRVVPRLGDRLVQWVRACRACAEVRNSLGIAAARHTPALLQAAGAPSLPGWTAGALRLAREASRGPQLAEVFLAASAPVFARHTPDVIDRWVGVLVELSHGAPAVAQAVLDTEWTWFARLSPHAAHHVLDLAGRFRAMSAPQAREWWRVAARALPALPPEAAEDVMAVAAQLVDAAPTAARDAVDHAPGVLTQLPARHHATLLALARDLATRDAEAAVGFFTTGAPVCDQLAPADLRTWFDEGLALLETKPDAAAAYFRGESQASAQRLRALRQVVHFDAVKQVLQRYAEALSAAKLGLRATDALPIELQALGRDLPTTDGRTIFLPPLVDRHGVYDANFADYKLAAAHQAGYFEFGTFAFDLDALADHGDFQALLAAAKARGPLRPVLSDYERFFTLFRDPALAHHAFAACEDARVDQHLADRYPGLRGLLAAAVADALAHRPALDALPLRQAAVEWLVRLSLARLDLPAAPGALAPLDRPLRHLLGHVLHHGATVTDAARATMQLYALLARLPNLPGATADAVDALLADAPRTFAEPPADQEWAAFFPDAAEGELPYGPPEDANHRGVLRPELVQKKAVVQVLQDALVGEGEEGAPLSAELLRQLLEMGVNINIKKLDLQQLLESSDLFITELDNRPALDELRGEVEELTDDERAEIRELLDGVAADVLDDPLEAERVFFYDEWDCDIEDYRHRWCRVKEVVVEPGDAELVGRAIREHADLIRSVREQFQLVKPEQLRKVRRLEAGEELELNEAIAHIIDRKTGRTPEEKIYQQRERQERDVATLFLLDVSASTDEWIEAANADAPAEPAGPPAAPPRPEGLLAFDDLRDIWQAARTGAAPAAAPRDKRIIDIERDAVIIMAEALRDLGDEYAICAFSGYGRENVDVFPVKRFGEPYADTVKARLAGLEPHKSTRMGPAVRHAIALLAEQPARVRTLILISDGYPQDFDYGKDRTSKTYGLHDTMVALQEARQAGILTFCITVDKAGHDYLRHMCAGRDYLVIEDVAALPRELPKVYRALTS